MAAVQFHNRRIPLTLATGAETTDIYDNFATEFSSLLSESGQRKSRKVEGVANTKEFDSIAVPQLTFGIGSSDFTLKPAVVLLSQLGPKWSYGNLGLDCCTKRTIS